MTDLLTLAGIGADGLEAILDLAETADPGRPLAGRGAALYFEKPSARTRNSMEMAVVQLGGHPVTIGRDEVGIDTRESAEDVARTLSCYHSLIAARVRDHRLLERLGDAAEVPVVNMLSDRHHPLQALADLLTLRQLLGTLAGARVAWIGDGDNNVCRSLAEGCSLAGVTLTIASPPGYSLPESLPGVRQVTDPAEAVAGAQAVFTDVWTSMGQDREADRRRQLFAGYRVDERLMEKARDAWFLHCLPANRGEEVSAAVIDGPRSAVWHQARNRMHAARGALAWLLGQGR